MCRPGHVEKLRRAKRQRGGQFGRQHLAGLVRQVGGMRHPVAQDDPQAPPPLDKLAQPSPTRISRAGDIQQADQAGRGRHSVGEARWAREFASVLSLPGRHQRSWRQGLLHEAGFSRRVGDQPDPGRLVGQQGDVAGVVEGQRVARNQPDFALHPPELRGRNVEARNRGSPLHHVQFLRGSLPGQAAIGLQQVQFHGPFPQQGAHPGHGDPQGQIRSERDRFSLQLDAGNRQVVGRFDPHIDEMAGDGRDLGQSRLQAVVTVNLPRPGGQIGQQVNLPQRAWVGGFSPWLGAGFGRRRCPSGSRRVSAIQPRLLVAIVHMGVECLQQSSFHGLRAG